MKQNENKIFIRIGNEMKTSQQLTVLHIEHQLPYKVIEIDGIKHEQLTENGIIYANLNEDEVKEVLRLPYVIKIEPCED